MNNHHLIIYYVENDQTIQFAAHEFKKYVNQMSDRYSIAVKRMKEYDASKTRGIWLGLLSDFRFEEQFHLEDPEVDDAVHIDISSGQGMIAGSNDRSVLIGCYRFLTEAGCRFVRPGKDGEYIPAKEIGDIDVKLQESPSYRHRGICIEGAVNYQNVKDMIDWIPKVGLNGYFIQFREAFTFFERWYTHRNNPYLQPESFTVEMARELVERVGREISKRDLLHHAVGHGWTCEPFGLSGLGWDPVEHDLAPEVSQYLAEVNGKREVWQGIPLNTNLCYSNNEIRRVIIHDILNYLQNNRDVDYLHFWLADGANNHCECENCKKMIPSNYYVKMLNELDGLLEDNGIDTKIVFLIYVDLLWAPEVEKIQNPDRFIMMFAPITRTYSQPFTAKQKEVRLPEFERNRLQFSPSIDDAIGFLKSWQNAFTGDSFDFDYHFMWDHYFDPGYVENAKILHKDIQNLKRIGLNGLISCQVQRAFFPTSLGMYVMGKTLWNDQLTFDDIAQDYFEHAFGKEGDCCSEYLSLLSRLFDPPYIRGEKDMINTEQAEKYKQIPEIIEKFVPIIERNMQLSNPCHAKSWYVLHHHASVCTLLASILEARARGEDGLSGEYWNELEQYVQKNEEKLQPVLDVFEFIHSYARKV